MGNPSGTQTDVSKGPSGAGRRREVQDLLDRLARAMTSGDTRAAAALWEPPAFVIGDEQVMAVSSREEIEGFFDGAKEQYNAQGITDTRGEIQRLEWATDRIAVVDVRWPYLDERGEERGSESSTYTLRRDDGGALRLRVALMRGVAKQFGSPQQESQRH